MDIAPTFLNDYSSHIYENILSLGIPIISTPDFLRVRRKITFLKHVQKIINIPYHEREKLLEPLVDYALQFDISNPDAMQKAYGDLTKKLKNNPQYGHYFERLDRMFDSLNFGEKLHILKMSITKIKTKVESMRLMISDKIINEKGTVKLVLLDQVLYSIQEFSDILLSKLARHKKKLQLVGMGMILVLTLKLEAVRRGKIPIESMEEDIALSSVFIRPKHILITKQVAEPVLALLGE